MSCRQLLMAGVLLLVGTGHATAQTGTPPTVDLAAGWVGFADDGIVSELPVTGAIRLYVTPRISIGAELTHIAGRSHSHQVLTGNLALDLVTSRPGRVTPFLLIGGGPVSHQRVFRQHVIHLDRRGLDVGRRPPLSGESSRIGWGGRA